MHISFSETQDVGIIQLQGDLNVVQVDSLRQKFTEWFSAQKSIKNIIIDLTDVPMIDSAGLGLLISFLKQARERNGELHFFGAQKRVRMVFDITRTNRIFGFFESLEEATSAFND